MRTWLLFLAIPLVSSCNNGGAPSSEDRVKSESSPEVAPILREPLSDNDLLRVCRGGAAFRNGRSTTGIAAEVAGEQLVRLSYRRDDGKFFEYDCQVDGIELRYRMIDERGPGTGPGVWSGRGSRTTYELSDKSILFIDDFFDGSRDIKRIEI